MSTLPVYNNTGEPTPPERFVQDSIDRLTNCFTHPFRGISLEYWLLDPSGQAYTLFLTTLVGVSIWLFYSNEKLKAVVALRSAHARLEDDVLVEADVDSGQDEDGRPLPSSPGASSLAREETPIMRKLAPLGHRPTNAHLESSHFRVAKPLGPRSDYFMVSGYRTPAPAKSRLSKAFSTRPLHCDHLSDVAKDAPNSSQTFEGRNMLNADRTPTKKKEAEKRAKGILGFGRKAQIEDKPVVAHWSNEAGRNDGRATLRHGLNDENLA